MSELFKERANTHNIDRQKELTDELLDAVATLKKLLFCSDAPEKYVGTGGNHTSCSGFDDKKYEFKDEERLCKCLYYYKNSFPKKCNSCTFLDRYELKGFRISNYQVPPIFKPAGIGEIDLIIKLDNEDDLYATEVKSYADDNKPARGKRTEDNKEPLIRMVAEIVTYTYGDHRFKKAIGFFEKSPQHDEFKTLSPNSSFMKLIREAEVTVFLFTRREPDIQNGKVITEGTISISTLFRP